MGACIKILESVSLFSFHSSIPHQQLAYTRKEEEKQQFFAAEQAGKFVTGVSESYYRLFGIPMMKATFLK